MRNWYHRTFDVTDEMSHKLMF